MRGLILKDFCLMKVQAKFLLIIVFVTIFLHFNSDGTFAVSYLVMIAAILGISTISYDEMDNGYGFLFSLPVSRRQFVMAKYIFNLLMGGLAWIIGFTITTSFWLIRPGEGSLPDIFLSSFVFVPIILLIQAVMLPIMLKFGSEMGRIMLLIVLGAVCAVCYAAGKFFEMAGIPLAAIVDSMSKYSIGAIQLILVVAAVVIWSVSLIIATKIVQKKEF